MCGPNHSQREGAVAGEFASRAGSSRGTAAAALLLRCSPFCAVPVVWGRFVHSCLYGFVVLSQD